MDKPTSPDAASPDPKQIDMFSSSRRWRDILPVHPACDLFPLLPRDELQALAKDIAERDVLVPVVIWYPPDAGPRQLLDGRNRLDACELAGIAPIDENGELRVRYRRYDGDDPQGHVTALNITRRHLTTHDRRKLAAKLIRLAPERSNRSIADDLKLSPTTVGKVRHEVQVSKLDTSATTGAPQSSEQVTKLDTSKRIGRDGKAYSVPRPAASKPRPQPRAEPGDQPMFAIADQGDQGSRSRPNGQLSEQLEVMQELADDLWAARERIRELEEERDALRASIAELQTQLASAQRANLALKAIIAQYEAKAAARKQDRQPSAKSNGASAPKRAYRPMTVQEAAAMRRMRASGETLKAIAKKFDRSPSVVHRCVNE